jgi:pimeloyl-ACP methyl ester carboxylesterase
MRSLLPIGLALTLSLPACSSAKDYKVDTASWVPVRNGRLYLEVKGQGADRPLLLWLHGGPGGAERPMFQLFNGELEEDFRVAYLDQRGAGRSFRSEEPAHFLSVGQHVEDLGKAIGRLKAGRNGEKVILVGHSWGAELAILYADRHPEDVEAVIAVNPVISEARKQVSQFETLGAAAQKGDAQAGKLIRRLGPPPWSADEEAEVEKAVGKLGGIWFQKPNFLAILAKAIVLGFIRPGEIGTFIEANRRSLAAMNDELLKLDLAVTVKKVDTPVAVFIGAHDQQAPPAHAIEFLKGLQSEQKLLIRFEKSAHNIPFEEAAAFNSCLVKVAGRLSTGEQLSGNEGACPYEILTY